MNTSKILSYSFLSALILVVVTTDVSTAYAALDFDLYAQYADVEVVSATSEGALTMFKNWIVDLTS